MQMLIRTQLTPDNAIKYIPLTIIHFGSTDISSNRKLAEKLKESSQR